ncbi:MAG TPA: hypothetical protein VJH03_22220 [Blastocatellia bacterium]|nr:hypothetical protein [Blastocatellia bacterium]
MKKHIALITLTFFTLALLPRANAQGGRESANQSARQITIGFGKRVDDCSPPLRSFCLVIELKCMQAARKTRPRDAADANVRVDNDHLSLDFTSPPPPGLSKITLDQDLSLDQCTASALGYQALTLQKGEYSVQRSGTKYWKVTVRMRGSRSAGTTKS